MNDHYRRVARLIGTSLAAASVMTLSACGGGGASGVGTGSNTVGTTPNVGGTTVPIPSNATAFSSFNSMTNGTTYSAKGTALEVNASSTSIASHPATVSLTAGANGPTFLQVKTDDSGSTIKDPQNNVVTHQGINVYSNSSDGTGGTQIFADQAAGPPTYNYQMYGGWATNTNQNATGQQTFGVFSAGAPVTGSLPTTAQYNGTSTGFVSDGNGGNGLTKSTVSVTADFQNKNVTVASTGTQIISDPLAQAPNITPSNLDFSASGKISGTTFTAKPALANGTGSVNGAFYGPKAAEVGGTFSLVHGSAKYMGAFGAK